MAKKTREVDTTALEIGMFVAQLDRPWLETTFLFQGFKIRTQEEIEDLQRYCNRVFIEVDEFEAPDARRVSSASRSQKAGRTWRSGSGKSGSILQRLAALFGRKHEQAVESPKPGEYYQDKVELKEELTGAEELHLSSLDKMGHVLDAIRQGGAVRIPELEAVAGSMMDSVLRNSAALPLLVRMKKQDDYTYAHSISTAVWALVFGRHLGLDQDSLKAVGLGGLLLDVGKTRLPRELLTKMGPYTPDDIAQARSHIELGIDVLNNTPGVDSRVLDMVATHHERFDGSGYPEGLKSAQIPVFGRIAGIVDSYAAMTSDRPYASAVSSYNAMREFRVLSGKTFQPEMVEQFIQAIGIFPAGSLVELNTGEIGVVLKEHKFHRLRPQIIVIMDGQKQPLAELKIVDLHEQTQHADGPPDVWIETGIEPGTYGVDPGEYFL